MNVFDVAKQPVTGHYSCQQLLCCRVCVYRKTLHQPYPSCPSSRPENRKPSTGDALTDLNSGMTNTVAARNVRKSRPRGTKGSGAAVADTFLCFVRLGRCKQGRRRAWLKAVARRVKRSCSTIVLRDKLARGVFTDLRLTVGGPVVNGFADAQVLRFAFNILPISATIALRSC